MPTPQPTLQAAGKPDSLAKIAFLATVKLDIEGKNASTMTDEEKKIMEEKGRKLPTFIIKAYTGSPMNVDGFYNPVVVDLAGIKAERNKIPILMDHDRSKIIGQTDGITIDASGVSLTGTITGEDVNTLSIITHAKNGFEWQASIGAISVRQEFLKANEKTVVNSREVSGPLTIIREARLYETSFVALGADSQTTVAVAASVSQTLKGVNMNFDKWLEAKGINPESPEDNTKKALQAAYDADQKPPPATQSLDDIVAAQRKEDLRVNEVTRIAAEAINDRPIMLDHIERMAKTAIEAKSPVQDFELMLMRSLRSQASLEIHGRSESRLGGRMIEAAICMSGGLHNPEKHYDEPTLNAAADRFPHGLGLRDLLMIAARENGYIGHTASDVRGLLKAAFSEIKAEFSTLSLPGILSNVANKFLVAGFNAVESSWREIAAVRSVRDFKTNTSYSLTGGMVYEQVGPGGELKHATVGELSYTNKAETYGRMFAITRADIINDDLGALTGIPTKLGRGAALKLNSVFWTAFLANLGTFWSVAHSNVSTGAGSALSPDGLKAAQGVFRKQTDADGLPLGILPKILLVPSELEITADELMTSLILNTGGSSTVAQVPNRNVWASKYRTVTTSYLSNSTITGYSATAWWLLADPADLPVIEVCFLNGRETPIVESADADFNVLGIQMRGYHDFGCNKTEYRGSVRSAGA